MRRVGRWSPARGGQVYSGQAQKALYLLKDRTLATFWRSRLLRRLTIPSFRRTELASFGDADPGQVCVIGVHCAGFVGDPPLPREALESSNSKANSLDGALA